MLRKNLLAGATAIAATALLAATAAPASADDTEVTFDISAAGGLAISAPETADLGSDPSSASTTTASGSLGATTVTDGRGGTAEWVVTAVSDAFTGPGLPASTAVAYSPGVITPGGTVTPTPAPDANITDDLDSETPLDTVVTTSTVSGNNTATWDPTLAVTLPAGALVGEYAGTVTVSVA